MEPLIGEEEEVLREQEVVQADHDEEDELELTHDNNETHGLHDMHGSSTQEDSSSDENGEAVETVAEPPLRRRTRNRRPPSALMDIYETELLGQPREETAVTYPMAN
ncbi:unnamed protein product [Linum trigynum]|uniref:Uncharacterized protein n=1 Tax=Linum trigynum TaxID=586398 RepID=A0AAV2DT40_9ROSI